MLIVCCAVVCCLLLLFPPFFCVLGFVICLLVFVYVGCLFFGGHVRACRAVCVCVRFARFLYCEFCFVVCCLSFLLCVVCLCVFGVLRVLFLFLVWGCWC